MVDLFKSMTDQKKMTFIVSLCLIFIFLLVCIYWLVKPKFEIIYKDLDLPTAKVLVEKLINEKVDYKIEESNSGVTILVPSGIKNEAKVSLGSEINTLDGPGMELFDTMDYSMSEFSQNVAYKRALQGELSRTISSMNDIKSCRVHLTFSPKTLFEKDKTPAKASVYIELENGMNLTSDEVHSIAGLVAGSVEYLELNHVSVFDEFGTKMSGFSSDDSSHFAVGKQLETVRNYEAGLVSKSNKILSKLFSINDYVVSANATMNFDKRSGDTTDYIMSNNGKGVVLNKEESKTPGASSNHRGNSKDASADNSDVLKNNIRYGYGTKNEEVVFASWSINRISVGVLISKNIDVITLLSR